MSQAPFIRAVLLVGALSTPAALSLGCTRSNPAAEKTRLDPSATERERYVDACLDRLVEGENSSQLWRDLAKFAFALPDEDTEPERAEAVLDRAAKTVAGLESEAGWSSAGRYFQAENFHAFERPACARAWKLRNH